MSGSYLRFPRTIMEDLTVVQRRSAGPWTKSEHPLEVTMFFGTTASILQFGQDTASRTCSLMMKARELRLDIWLEWVPLPQPASWDQVDWRWLFGVCVPWIFSQQKQEESSADVWVSGTEEADDKTNCSALVSSISKAAGSSNMICVMGSNMFKQCLCSFHNMTKIFQLQVGGSHQSFNHCLFFWYMLEATRSPEPWVFDAPAWSRVLGFKKRRAIGKGNKFVWAECLGGWSFHTKHFSVGLVMGKPQNICSL